MSGIGRIERPHRHAHSDPRVTWGGFFFFRGSETLRKRGKEARQIRGCFFFLADSQRNGRVGRTRRIRRLLSDSAAEFFLWGADKQTRKASGQVGREQFLV